MSPQTESGEPLLSPNEARLATGEGPEIPEDFKYADIVAECTIDIRHQFMRRVYTLLVAQLVITAGLSAFIMANASFQLWILSHQWSMWVAVFFSFAFMLAAMAVQRQYPLNLFFLFLFTISESFMVGVSTSMFDTRIVLDAFLITVVVFSGLSMFALQCRYDFTGWLPYLMGALFSLLGLGIISLFTHSSAVELAYSYIAVVVFSGFILVDTQLILTRFHPDDEVPAAIQLYLDILNLFLNILRILSNSDDN